MRITLDLDLERTEFDVKDGELVMTTPLEPAVARRIQRAMQREKARLEKRLEKRRK